MFERLLHYVRNDTAEIVIARNEMTKQSEMKCLRDCFTTFAMTEKEIEIKQRNKFMRTKILLSILSLMILIIGCSKSGNKTEQKPKPKSPLVKVQEIKFTPISKSIKLTGTVEAKVMTTVVAPSDGYI